MADKKISQLTGATTPLDGTEVLPIVQSGSTVKVANNDLRPKQIQSNATSGVLQVAGPAAAATRVMTTPDANFSAARIDAGQTFTGTQTFSGQIESLNTSGAALNNGQGGTSGLTLLHVGAAGTDFYQGVAGSGGSRLNSGSSAYMAEFRNDTGFSFGNGTQFAYVASAGVQTTGNFIQGTAAKGVNFTANTPAAGMTSQLLNWYEEGTWTVAWTSVTGTPSNTTGYYTRVGRVVTFSYAAGANSLTGVAGTTRFSLPFSPAQYSAGSIASQLGTVSGSLEIDAGDFKAYPTAFSSAYMIFAGSYMV